MSDDHPTIEHVDIPGGEIHEPKDIDLAGPDQVYVSDGSGTGQWRDINDIVLTPFKVPFGSLRLTADFVLNKIGIGGFNPEDPTRFRDDSANFEPETLLNGFVAVGGGLEVPEDGNYEVSASFYIDGPTNDATQKAACFVPVIDGTPFAGATRRVFPVKFAADFLAPNPGFSPIVLYSLHHNDVLQLAQGQIVGVGLQGGLDDTSSSENQLCRAGFISLRKIGEL